MNLTLRRLGSASIVLALVALGCAFGMVSSSPARAQGSDNIQVKMPAKQLTTFTSGATPPLLDVADLAPGGSVSGTMAVRNNSGDVANLSLTMTVTGTGDRCADDRSACDALADELRLALDVTKTNGGAPVSTWSGTVAELTAGVTLAKGLPDQGVRWVTLSASLPAQSTGDEVAFGGLAFTLQLGLAGVAGESTHVVGPHGGNQHHSSQGVLGVTKHRLAATGAPVAALLVVAGALLLVGAVLLRGARSRRRAWSDGPSQI